jgi:hypothetical protein
MAAWALAMSVVVVVGVASGTGRAQSGPPAATTARNTIRLQLQISGLRQDGCTLKITPGHPGCQFAPIERRIASAAGRYGGMIRLDPIVLDASTTSADRDCSFAITLTEPGGTPRTYRRGVRLEAAPAEGPAPSQTVKVYLSAPSLAARDGGTPRR